MIEEFAVRLRRLAPDRNNMLVEGTSEKRIKSILTLEFNLLPESETISVNSKIEDFINNYKINLFEIVNISFTKKAQNNIINGHSIFGYIYRGYISYKESTKQFFTSYAEDYENSMELLCDNEDQFFKILLILAEYNKNSYEGNLPDENYVETYIDRCEEICWSGSFDRLFL